MEAKLGCSKQLNDKPRKPHVFFKNQSNQRCSRIKKTKKRITPEKPDEKLSIATACIFQQNSINRSMHSTVVI